MRVAPLGTARAGACMHMHGRHRHLYRCRVQSVFMCRQTAHASSVAHDTSQACEPTMR